MKEVRLNDTQLETATRQENENDAFPQAKLNTGEGSREKIEFFFPTAKFNTGELAKKKNEAFPQQSSIQYWTVKVGVRRIERPIARNNIEEHIMTHAHASIMPIETSAKFEEKI